MGAQGEGFSHQGARCNHVGELDEKAALTACSLLLNRKQDLIRSCEQTDLAKET